MADDFKNPLKQLLLDKMIDKGFFNAKDIDRSTIQTISDLEDSDILKLLKEFGVGPTIAKKEGGIVHMEKGGDALLGKLVANLKNKPKLASATETMTDVMDALGDKDTITTRPSSAIANIQKGSKVERLMGPKIFQVLKKAKITEAQINQIIKVPDINDYTDDFDGFNKAMKKYRTTALKGLNPAQLDAVRSSGFLSGYAEQMRRDFIEKGSTIDADGKVKIKPKYKNVLSVVNNKVKIPMSAQNKFFDDNFDFVFKNKATATGVKKPTIQSQVYSKIQEIGKKTLNKAQQLNLDFALAQVDKLFKTAPDKAKATLKEIAKAVKTGKLFMAGGPMTFLAESMASDPDFQNMLLSANPDFARTLGVDAGPQSFRNGGPVDMPGKKEEVSSDFIAQAEIALKNAMREKGSNLTESEKLSLAFQLANPSKKVSDPSKSDEDNIKIFEDKVNKMVDVLTMIEGSAIVDLNKKDRISDDVLDFMKRGMNKFNRMLN